MSTQTNASIGSSKSTWSRWRAGRKRIAPLVGRFGVLVALCATFGVFAGLRPHTFLTSQNLTAILWIYAPLAVFAFGVTVILSMGDFDLTPAAVAGLGGTVAALMMSRYSVWWPVAILVALACAGVVGLVNGFLVGYLGGHPFIITLGMATVVTGVNWWLSGQQTIFEHIAAGYVNLGRGDWVGVRYQIWVALAVLLATYFLLDLTEIGRYMRAIGGNTHAAVLSGLNVRLIRLCAFVVVALCACVAGVLITSSAASSTPDDGLSLLLPGYAACFIGAATFRPGTFNSAGTLVGILLLGVIQNGLTLLNASLAVIYVIQGSILVGAVLLMGLGGSMRQMKHI